MSIHSFLNVYSILAVGLIVFSWTSLGWNIVALGWLRRRGPERNSSALKTPPPRTFLQTLRQYTADPWLRFHRRTNRLWAHGYLFYHLGIFTIVAGYAVTLLILALKFFHGAEIPNLTPSAAPQAALSPANFLAMVFGNAEPVQRHFLFGRYASLFLGVSWLELACAIYGQACLMTALLCFGQGAVRRAPDSASRNMPRDGRFSGQHLLVRSLIFTIVITEILARLQVTPGIVYYHAALGLTLLVLAPHTYLAHIFIAPIAALNGLRRRRLWTTA